MKKLIRFISSVLCVLLIMGNVVPTFAYAQGMETSIENLKVNDLKEPVGISNDDVTFSWQMKSKVKGEIQRAYQILVADDESFKDLLWDSNKVESDLSLNIRYEGKELKNSHEYYYKVIVWNKDDAKLSSKTESFITGLNGKDAWSKSKWIKAGKVKGKKQGSTTFRKEINIKNNLKSAFIYITGLGVYDVYIEGQRVGTKDKNGRYVYDELKPGFTHHEKRVIYNTYDITDLIKENTLNTISANVYSGWWSGAVAGPFWASTVDSLSFKKLFSQTFRRHNSFRAQLHLTYENGEEEIIGTDESWKSSIEGPVIYGDIYGGETYDSNADVSYRFKDYDDSKWSNAKVNDEFKGEIEALSGPAVRVRKDLERKPKGITIYNKITDETKEQYGKINVIKTLGDEKFTLKKGETAVVDMGQNFAGWDRIWVEGKKGTQITLRHAEMLNDDMGKKERGNDGPQGSIYTANLRKAKATGKYILSGKGIESYAPTSTFYGYQYVEITATDDVTIHKIRGEVVTSVQNDTGRIETSNAKINKLISNIIWGQYSNYLWVPTDCPQRDERKGWTADAQVFSIAACYNADSKGFLTQYIKALNDSQIEKGKYEGAFPDTAPYNRYGEIGQLGWSDAGIIIPYNLYLMYGDKSIIEECYPYMQKYMDAFMASTDKLGGGYKHGDWLAYENNDKEIQKLFGIAYYAWDAQMMSEMAEVLGKTEDIVKYREVFNEEKEYFIELFVNEDGSLKFKEQTACLMALKMNLLPNSKSEEIVTKQLINNIKEKGNKLGTGFLGTAIIMPTLSQTGNTDTAYKLLLQNSNPSWLYSVEQGATTVWERWNSYTKEDGFGNVAMNSFNHYAYGAVAQWMYSNMAGIAYDIENPGFKHIILQPEPSRMIKDVKASYDSPYGTIKSEWYYDNTQWLYSASIPANTTADVSIPVENNNTVYVNGKAMQDLNITDDGIEYIGTEDSKAMFKILSGDYEFMTKSTKQVLDDTPVKSVETSSKDKNDGPQTVEHYIKKAVIIAVVISTVLVIVIINKKHLFKNKV